MVKLKMSYAIHNQSNNFITLRLQILSLLWFLPSTIFSFLSVWHLFSSSLSLSMVSLKSLKAPITSETPETRWINVTCDHLLSQVMKMSHSTFFSIIVIFPQPSYENDNIFIFSLFLLFSQLMKVLTLQIFIISLFHLPKFENMKMSLSTYFILQNWLFRKGKGVSYFAIIIILTNKKV